MIFSKDFLVRYPAFRGDLSPADQRIGEHWFSIWTEAQASAAAALTIRASIERKAGRAVVADALDAAATALNVVDPAEYEQGSEK